VILADAEASEYVADLAGEYLGLAQVYSLADEPGHGAELFSLLRDSPLQPAAYLDAFFDTGDERQGVIETSEAWTAPAWPAPARSAAVEEDVGPAALLPRDNNSR
jgi:hypothetical protein